MLAALTLGLVLWLIYGVIRSDWVIIIANATGATLCGIVLGCKVRMLSHDAKRDQMKGRDGHDCRRRHVCAGRAV
jgi:hypothetical protein